MCTRRPPVRHGLPGAELWLLFRPRGEREVGIFNEKIQTTTWIHWTMSDFNCCICTYCMQGLAFLPHLHCSLGGYGQPQDATSPTGPDTAHLREGEQRGSQGQGAVGRQCSRAGARRSTAIAPLEEGPPALLSFAPILLWLWVGFTELLDGLTSTELRTDLNNFYTARMLFLCLPVAFTSVCVFLQFRALLWSCSGCISSLNTVESLSDA